MPKREMPDSDATLLDLRHDGAITDAYAAIQNNASGIGTSRSKVSQAGVGLGRARLGRRERIGLVEGDGVCRRLVFLYPDTAAMCWPEFVARDADGFNQGELQEYLRNLGGSPLEEVIQDASTEGRWHGDGYAIMNLEDGRGLEEPVDESNIESFAAIKTLFEHEVTPQSNSSFPDYYDVSAYREDFNDFSESVGGGKGFYLQRVHRDRILRLKGNRLTGASLELNQGRNQSALQVFYSAFSECYQGFGSASNMLADYSVFKYMLKGFGAMSRRGEMEPLLNRFVAMQMGMSTVKGLMLDKDAEDAEFINRSFGGVDSILEKLQESMVAGADIPWYKLIQSMKQGGLGSESGDEGQRFEWASMVEAYQVSTQKRPILKAARYAMLAKDGPTAGKLVPGLELDFPSCLRLSPSEKVAQRKTMAEAHRTNIEAGIYTAWEARDSSHGGGQFSVDVQLDKAISDRLEEGAKNPPESPQEVPTEEPREREPKPEGGQKTPSESLSPRADDNTRAKVRIPWEGFTIGLQYRPFDKRFGKTLPVGYGYLEKTLGADGMAADVYVASPIGRDAPIFAVSQVIDGVFDEEKFFIGLDSVKAVEMVYKSIMPAEFFGGARKVELSELEAMRTDRQDGASQIFADEDYEDLAEVTMFDFIQTVRGMASDNNPSA